MEGSRTEAGSLESLLGVAREGEVMMEFGTDRRQGSSDAESPRRDCNSKVNNGVSACLQIYSSTVPK